MKSEDEEKSIKRRDYIAKQNPLSGCTSAGFVLGCFERFVSRQFCLWSASVPAYLSPAA